MSYLLKFPMHYYHHLRRISSTFIELAKNKVIDSLQWMMDLCERFKHNNGKSIFSEVSGHPISLSQTLQLNPNWSHYLSIRKSWFGMLAILGLLICKNRHGKFFMNEIVSSLCSTKFVKDHYDVKTTKSRWNSYLAIFQ